MFTFEHRAAQGCRSWQIRYGRIYREIERSSSSPLDGPRHEMNRVFDECDREAPIVSKLRCAMANGNASPSADVFVKGTLVGVLKIGPIDLRRRCRHGRTPSPRRGRCSGPCGRPVMQWPTLLNLPSFFDVDVDQLARVLALIAAQRRLGGDQACN
jgi:hypothetical protein